MKGRKPKPAEVKLKAGNPGKRPLETTVIGGRKIPKMPAGLPKPAQTLWRNTIEIMSEAGVLDQVDGPIVESFVMTMHRMREARKVIEREGMFIEGQRGPTKHPAVAVERDCQIEVRQLADHLGIGPSGRARLGMTSKVKKDMTADMNDRVGHAGLRAIEGGRA